MESGYGPLDQATLNAINWLTAKGIVVELGNYNTTGSVATGQGLTDEVNWFSQLATQFKNNPYVWFSTALLKINLLHKNRTFCSENERKRTMSLPQPRANGAAVCGIMGKRLGDIRLRGQPLVCAAANPAGYEVAAEPIHSPDMAGLANLGIEPSDLPPDVSF